MKNVESSLSVSKIFIMAVEWVFQIQAFYIIKCVPMTIISRDYSWITLLFVKIGENKKVKAILLISELQHVYNINIEELSTADTNIQFY